MQLSEAMGLRLRRFAAVFADDGGGADELITPGAAGGAACRLVGVGLCAFALAEDEETQARQERRDEETDQKPPESASVFSTGEKGDEEAEQEPAEEEKHVLIYRVE